MEGAQLERGLEAHKNASRGTAIPSGEFPVGDWQAHYKAIRAKLDGQRPKPEPKPKPAPVVIVKPPEPEPEPEVVEEGKFSKDDMLITRGLKRDRIRAIILPILRRRNLTWEMIRGQNRHGPIVRGRSEVFFALVSNGYGFAETGRICGRDHTTVIHGVRRWKDRNGPDYRGYLAEPRKDARIVLSTVCDVTEVERPYKDES
jgi:hypothetical protein